MEEICNKKSSHLHPQTKRTTKTVITTEISDLVFAKWKTFACLLDWGRGK